MPHIAISKRRPDGSQARVELEVSDVKVLLDTTEQEKAEMLLEAEMNGNSSGKVRVHFNGF